MKPTHRPREHRIIVKQNGGVILDATAKQLAQLAAMQGKENRTVIEMIPRERTDGTMDTGILFVDR